MAATEGGWGELGHDLWRRTKRPLRHATFVSFFIGSVVGIGGLGIWVELINLGRGDSPVDLASLRTALATFFPALVGSTCFQIILGRYLKALKAVTFPASIALAVVGFWLIFDRGLTAHKAITIAILATIVSLWFWWIANADNPDFFDETLPLAAVGGDTARPLDGNLDGFDA
ncbi:hypothetical protein FSB78_10475 [Sphingomonas ginsenosidivorax]|uniref:Uncharacterized protein n=1 Tax=Sphingomonas ginsenosidivorax TaxID=862135 RepID=A0A5C6UF26_9SPHN|nr:hypothetical protein [Sphingomonas ginsenosidivorax]TXC71319.1 hypothetical protein FSB78_10475 [Sphingomonas ginsenosidivorax]